jgi:Protein of unknown function (DUF1552)
MFITRLSLPRRTFLRGIGASLALPWLDAMAPAASALAATVARPLRAGFIYVPHGADLATWTPPTTGRSFEFSPTLRVLESFKDSLVVITNLKRAGTVVEMHAAAAASWLSGALIKHTEGQDYRNGPTIDQVLAGKIGQGSPLPSLEFATEDYTGYVGGCTPGYSCAYMNTISWSNATTPLPMEINPRSAFERLFGDGTSAAERKRHAREDQSILDSIAGEARALNLRLGAPDRARVGDYLDHVREIERRIQRTEREQGTTLALPDKPIGTPDSFEEHTSLMFDLLALAFQTDLTRVFTFMMSREANQRTFNEIGIADPWHVVSHHGDQPEKVARAAKINVFCASMFAKFLDRLKNTPDGDGSLLDHALIFYGSGMGNSNVHATDPLPMLAAGGGAGTGNRHVVLPPKTEIGNLWLTIARHFDVPLDRFGEGTSTVDVL